MIKFSVLCLCLIIFEKGRIGGKSRSWGSFPLLSPNCQQSKLQLVSWWKPKVRSIVEYVLLHICRSLWSKIPIQDAFRIDFRWNPTQGKQLNLFGVAAFVAELFKKGRTLNYLALDYSMTLTTATQATIQLPAQYLKAVGCMAHSKKNRWSSPTPIP